MSKKTKTKTAAKKEESLQDRLSKALETLESTVSKSNQAVSWKQEEIDAITELADTDASVKSIVDICIDLDLFDRHSKNAIRKVIRHLRDDDENKEFPYRIVK